MVALRWHICSVVMLWWYCGERKEAHGEHAVGRKSTPRKCDSGCSSASSNLIKLFARAEADRLKCRCEWEDDAHCRNLGNVQVECVWEANFKSWMKPFNEVNVKRWIGWKEIHGINRLMADWPNHEARNHKNVSVAFQHSTVLRSTGLLQISRCHRAQSDPDRWRKDTKKKAEAQQK